jgi:3-oxoadipate enol-lactonase
MGEYLDVPAGRLYYEVDGSGHPLTLIHAGVAHLRMWDEQVAVWRDRWRVIRYDTRGFGRTLTDDVPYSNRDDLRRLLEHLGVERTHLLGLSRGAQIALDFTLEQPDLVSALVWVAGGVSGHDGPDDGVDWDAVEKLYEEKRIEELVERETQIWTDGLGQPPDRVDPELRRRMVEWNTQNYRAAQAADQSQPLLPPAIGRLDEVRVPVMAVWGDLDVASTLDAGEVLVSRVSSARRHVFRGVAHMVNLERPAEFNALVGDFLAEVERRR